MQSTVFPSFFYPLQLMCIFPSSSTWFVGPVSIKQEKSLGPALEFLKSVSNDGLLGNGTPSSPLKIVLMDI